MCLSSLWKEFRDTLFRDVSFSAHSISRNNSTKATISRGFKEQKERNVMGTEHLRTVAQGRIKKLAIKRVRSYVVEGIRDKLFSDVSYSVHNISR